MLARRSRTKAGGPSVTASATGTPRVTYMPDHGPTALGPGADGLGEYHAAALELATRRPTC